MALEINYSIKDSGQAEVFYGIKNPPPNEKMELSELLSFTKNALITIATEALRQEQAKGFDKNPVTIVDNKFNKKIFDVTPLGKIEFVARGVLKEIVIETYRQILEKSKVVTGRYISGNLVTINGILVANEMVQLLSYFKANPTLSPGDKIRFVNVEPYARKLENLGITRQKRSQKRVLRKKKRSRKEVVLPNGVYALTYNNIRRRFKRNVKIFFEPFLEATKLGITGPNTTFKTGRGKGRPYLYPTILLIATSETTDTGAF